MCSLVQSLLQGGRLRINPALPLAETLRDELTNFQVKVSEATGHESYGAWRTGKHDDMVFATALACFIAENDRPAPTLQVMPSPLAGYRGSGSWIRPAAPRGRARGPLRGRGRGY